MRDGRGGATGRPDGEHSDVAARNPSLADPAAVRPQCLHLDMVFIESYLFTNAARKRLYFANFPCPTEDELPDLESSPLWPDLVSEEKIRGYLADGVVDERFMHTRMQARNVTPFGTLTSSRTHSLVASMNRPVGSRQASLHPAR